MDILATTPFVAQKPGKRNPLPQAFLPQPPEIHEQVIKMSDFSLMAETKAMLNVSWAIPNQFSRIAVRLLTDTLEDMLIEYLRYELHLTYTVHVTYDFFQDCWMIEMKVELSPLSVSIAKDALWRFLARISEEETRFLKMKNSLLNSIYMLDLSGNGLIKYATDDLTLYHQLVPFEDEIRQIQATIFEDVINVAHYMTYERSFCFVLLP